jgi:hypothetical protein
LHLSNKVSSASTRSQKSNRGTPLASPADPANFNLSNCFSALLPSSMSHPYPTHFSFLAPAVLHAHLATCTHLHFPLPHPFMHSLTTIGFLSQISSLSAPGPTGPTGPLTAVTSPSGQAISPRFGWAHRTIPAVRVSPLPCFRPRIDGHRLLCSPLMGSRPRAETPPLAQPQPTISRP